MSTTDASVLSIIAAFTSGFDIFRKLSARHRKRPRGHAGNQANERSREELRLSKSLRRGPVDIQREYERNLQGAGERYAIGDSIAQTSLAETLLKLNTGLVGIISAFLTHPRNNAHLDYHSLTTLSDASRTDAIDALGQLYYRVSRSNVASQRLPANPPQYNDQIYTRKHGQKHDDGDPATKATEENHNTVTTHRTKNRDIPSKPAMYEAGTTVFTIKKIPISASQKQLAIVRPRKKDRSLSSSTTSSQASSSSSTSTSQSTASTALTTPCASPAALPELAGSFPFPLPPQRPIHDVERDRGAPPKQQGMPQRKPVPPPAGREDARQANNQRPRPPVIPPKPFALRPPPAYRRTPPPVPTTRALQASSAPPAQLHQFPPPSSARPYLSSTSQPPPPFSPQTAPPLLPSAPPQASASPPPKSIVPAAPIPPAPPSSPPPPLLKPRRREILTPSLHSFASDSTKLGEIPMRAWAGGPQWDAEAMERLNREARVNGWVPGVPDVREKERKGLRGLLGGLRRGR